MIICVFDMIERSREHIRHCYLIPRVRFNRITASNLERQNSRCAKVTSAGHLLDICWNESTASQGENENGFVHQLSNLSLLTGSPFLNI